MLVSAVQQSDSVIHIYIYILFHILFHYGLSQDIEYSSLCSTVGPCCLPILYMFVSANPKLPIHPSLTPLPLSKHKSVLYICESVSQISSIVSYFRFHM